MPDIPVVWRNYLEGVQSRGFYDQTFLEWMFAQPSDYTFTHSEEFPDAPGIVLVTPGHYRNTDQLEQDIRRYDWVLLIVTSDEEGQFPFWGPKHSNMSIWKHTPRDELPHQPDRPLMLGWTPGTVEANQSRPIKDLGWVFAGQDGPQGNRRREQAVQVMRTMDGGELHVSEGFLQGLGRDEYFELMRRARVVPCPSGPNIPDTFRVYEALESGAVPVADATCPRGDWGYWQRIFPTPPPFPVVSDWLRLPEIVSEAQGQAFRVRVLAWWEQTKREMVWRLSDDVRRLSADSGPGEGVTVLMPTSPIPSHPSTEIISETLESVRQRLPDAEIFILCDDVRTELEFRRPDYEEYLESLVWLARKHRAVPLVFDGHQHQANMTRFALSKVRTDLVFFVEHDTPLVGEIPFQRLSELVLGEDFHVVRLHHEAQIPSEHDWLMRGKVRFPWDSEQIRLMRTVQWSQRPHLARTSRYREWVDRIPMTRRTMIEDVFHGPVSESEWDEYKIGIYLPDGSIKRSAHLDGRGEDSKFEDTMG